jgi:hypothetical protein
MPAGYSHTPLLKKLGIKPGHRILLYNPIRDFLTLLGDLPEGATVLKGKATVADFIHVFVDREEELLRLLPEWKAKLEKNGLIWVSWPKKASGLPTDLDRDQIREIGLNAGLVDVKVCAIDENWSGLKFVYRLQDRT